MKKTLLAAVLTSFIVFNGCDNGGSSSSNSNAKRNAIADTVGSGVMLQGFNWNSANLSSGWYSTVNSNANSIKYTFKYVWCPPPSDAGSNEGYMPRQLNVLDSKYGSTTELKSMITGFAPAKAIADIVINHRVGTSNWGTFTNPSFGDDYYAICSDDEGFSTSGSDMYGSTKKGAADTGDGYGAARDLDHTNSTVQDGIISWMTNYLKAAGFAGWRYDFVKGYAGKYVGIYDKATSAEFSVGEYWPTAGYNSSAPSVWGDLLKNWVSATEAGGYRSCVFDFTLKGALETVFGNSTGKTNSNYSLLADSSNLYISQPTDAVTFVDNHDTGSTQALWPLDSDDVGTAYALILTHPGIPCVAWQHYFTASESNDSSTSQYLAGNTVPGTSNTLRQHIDELIKFRKMLGIKCDSTRTTLKASSSVYAAKIEGTYGNVIVAIGDGYTCSESGYSELYSGTNFKIWGKYSSNMVMLTSSDTWLMNDNYKIFANVTTASGTSWVECSVVTDVSGSTSTVLFNLPDGATEVYCVRVPESTTTATVEAATKANITNTITLTSGTQSYTAQWNSVL